MLEEDLGFKPYKKIVQPLLTGDHKAKRIQFTNWVRHHYPKNDTMPIVFSDEKMFDIDGVYNAQNDRVWAVNRAEADESGGIEPARKFPQRVMVWLAVCSKGVSPPVFLDKGSVNDQRYIEDVLPVALKFGNRVFGKNNWIFQQDGAGAHTHHSSQKWCQDHFPNFIDKDHWPPNSPDLNPLDYSIWEEYVQAMDWSKVFNKATLKSELKRAVKKIRPEVILETCNSWTIRLNRVCKNGGDYYGK